MKRRSAFFTIYSEFRALIKIQHSELIKLFRFDLGGTHTSNDFTQLLVSDSTMNHSSCAYTSSQNNIGERKHHHLFVTARSFL